MTFLSFDVLGVFQSSSFICLQIWMHLWFTGIKIFCQNKIATRELQESWPLTFLLNNQYLASFSRLSFEYKVGSLLTANIQRDCTCKNAQFLSHSDLDLQKIDLFLYGSIHFMVMHQYQYVVQPDRLNYGIIGTCLRKGLYLSKTDCEGITIGLERKWCHLYMKSFEKWWI